MMIRKVLWGAVLLSASCVFAQDAQLDALRKTLLPMRGRAATAEGRGFPELTTVKHQLRDWVESRLAMLAPDGNRDEFERQLNRGLDEVSLPDDFDDLNLTGWIGGIHLEDTA